MSVTQIEISNKKNETENMDLLGRKEFIDSVIKYVDFYSDQKRSISFSINGEWGSGKTWVIDNIITKLYEIQTEKTYSDKFCVFKYNAWDFDYYEEPLIALIIAMKEQIDSENAVFIKSKEGLEKWNATKKVIKKSAYKSLHELLENAAKIKIVPFSPVSSNISMIIKAIGLIGSNMMNLKDQVDEEIKQKAEELRNYDEYFDLKTLLKTVKDAFSKFTKDRTVVIVIDELDRCLPEYAIKVLERMHHLCEGINNIQFIYAIDDKQLANTVKQIFGNEVSVRSYLSKFMTFGLRLPEVSFNELIEIRYKEFNSIFSFLYSEKCSLYEIISKPLGEIPIRSKIQILEKVKIINQLILHNKKDFDFSILYFELFITYCDYYDIDLKNHFISYSGITNPNKRDNNDNLEKCNKMFLYLMNYAKTSRVQYDDVYLVNCNSPIYDFLPFYFKLYCNEKSTIEVSDYYFDNDKDKIRDILNNFWNYYKTMEL